MALTTKKFSVPITLNYTYSYSNNLSSEIVSYGVTAASWSFFSFVSDSESCLVSTIYTVPSGKTAKILIDPVGTYSVSYKNIYSIATSIRTGRELLCSGIQDDIDFAIRLGFNNYYSYSLSDGAASDSAFNPYSVSATSSSTTVNTSLSYAGGFEGLYSLSNSFRGPRPYLFMGAGQSLDLSFSFTTRQRESWRTNTSASSNMIISQSRRVSTSIYFISYLSIMVIEESGS